MFRLWIIFGTIVATLFIVLGNIVYNEGSNQVIDVKIISTPNHPVVIPEVNRSWKFSHCTPTNKNCGKFE
jgi:hypothetical protein